MINCVLRGLLINPNILSSVIGRHVYIVNINHKVEPFEHLIYEDSGSFDACYLAFSLPHKAKYCVFP